MMNQDTTLNLLNSGFLKARSITKKYARTFYFASHFLDSQIRQAVYSVYAICRISDDAVDDNAVKSGQGNLGKIKENIDLAYGERGITGELLLAFRNTVKKYKIPREYFYELIDGMRMDLEKKVYADFLEVYDYCYKVSSVIGLMLLQIFGYRNPLAKKYAIDLGIAMQLTNILRDIKEDYARGRIYLPANEMKEYGISSNHIAEEKVDEKFKNFIRYQIKRARQYYRESEAGIKMINGPMNRLTVEAMKNMYAGILQAIEKNGYDVFSRRAHTNTMAKAGCVLAILLKGHYL